MMHFKRINLFIRSLLLLALCAPMRSTAAQAQPIDLALAHQYFQEAQAICTRDEGRLWGVSLCGPMLLVEPETRTVVANQPDARGLLSKQGEVFVGHWPETENIANTAVTWAGAKWTMILWPLPTDVLDRRRLMMHELFHRVQDELKFALSNPSNDHLDTRDGRLWLQLEWRSLRAALTSTGARRQQAITDALAFRANWRRGLTAQADLGVLLAQAAQIKVPAALKELAARRGEEYDGRELRAAEDARERARAARLTAYRARLVTGPTLVLPLTEQVQYSFNPNNLVPLEGLGTVYPTLRVSDAWGILEVSNGALMARDGRAVSKVYVAAPTDAQTRPLKGDGWTLQ